MEKIVGILVISFLLACGLLIKKKREHWFAPDVFFALFWFCLCFFASLQLFGMWAISLLGWFLIFLGSVSFLLGSQYSYLFSPRHNDYFIVFNEKIFFTIIVLLYLNDIPSFFRSVQYLMSGVRLDQLREAYFGGDIAGVATRSRNGIDIIKGSIFSTMHALIVASSINQYCKTSYKRFLYPILGLVVMSSFINGGRFEFAYFAIELIACESLYKSPFLSYFSTPKRNLVPIISFLGGMVVVISLMRGVDFDDLLCKYYRYFCGSLVFFDQHLDNLNASEFYSFPYASLYGFWHQFLPIMTKIGFDYPIDYLNTVSSVLDTQTFRAIGNGMMTNAFITPFYVLYYDLRYLGLFLGMFLFGFFAQRTYNNAKNTFAGIDIVAYLITMRFLFESLSFYPLTASFSINAFLFLFILRFLKIGIV